MAPKPFPYPIGVGVDICHIPRLHNIVGKRSDYVTRWARKIFTRLEWPHLWQKFYESNIPRASSGVLKAQLWLPRNGETTDGTHPASSTAEVYPSVHKRALQYSFIANHSSQNVRVSDRYLPGQAPVEDKPLSPSLYAATHEMSLTQYLAGRWAAKEATIKAHRNRRLSLNDISILHPAPSSAENFSSSTNKQKLQALIAPESTTMVVMTSQIAKLRGLLERQSRFPPVYGDVVDGQFVKIPEPNKHGMLTTKSGRKFWVRGLRIKEDEQQIAEINISHDHGYAVAICMALDEKASSRDFVDYVVDDGSGERIHEPEWGDEGWLDDISSISSSDVDEHLFS